MMVRARISNLLRIITILVMGSFVVNTALALDGSGREEDPWRIKSLEDFNDFAADANYWDDYTRLETDVNLAGQIYTTAVIAPDTNNANYLQFDGTAFTGVFDGNDHKIIGLTIDDGGAYNCYLGLFGYIDEGEVSNLGLEGGSVSGNWFLVASLAGYNGGIISYCYSIGDVSGYRFVGCLVGENGYSVLDCYSIGDINGNVNVGSLVGYNGGCVSNCYSTGNVSGDVYVGGLVGYNGDSVSNCYCTGDVNGADCVGGLVGRNSYYSSVSNCFWDIDTQTHGVTESIGLNEGTATNVAGLPTAQMQTSSTFTDASWDFIDEQQNGTTETWKMPSISAYPVLSFFQIDIPLPLTGSGTVTDPYLVEDANELGMVNWYPAGCHFKQTRDIDLSGIHWSVSVMPAFSGYFNGDGHKLANLQISGGGWLGLFGYLGKGAQVSNLGLEAVYVSGTADHIGGLVGVNDGSVSNSYSTGDVSGDWFVGGLVGCNYGGVSNCYSTGDVAGDWSVGGLVSINYGNVLNCNSTGDVSGNNRIGGLVGWNTDHVSNCYYTGNVSGINRVGALVGDNWDGRISNCYAIGDVNGTGSLIGGLVGENDDDGSVWNCYSISDVSGDDRVGGLMGANVGSVSNCFWDIDTQTHGVTDSIGLNEGTATNIAGLPTAQMQTKSPFTGANWDFTNVWDIGENQTYPYLRIYLPSDINKDRIVNFLDLAITANQWLQEQ